LRSAICLLAAALTACQVHGLAGAQTPAKLVAPTPQCLSDVQAFATQATGRSVQLTQAAFATSDELLLERRLIRDAHGRPLDGSSRDRPEGFQLQLRGDACVVIHPRSGTERVLTPCNCTALKP